jgi:hypothetical protein
MGEKKPTLEELAQKIDQLLDVLREISEDLTDISKNLKSVGGAPISTPPPATPTPPSPAAGIRSVAELRTIFPKELEDMLFFEEQGQYIIIKPRRFLGSENFAKIASLIRSAGGEYISAGRDSHFRIHREIK